MAARTYSHNADDVVISVIFVGSDYKLVVRSKTNSEDVVEFLMCKGRRYNGKFHKSMDEVVSRNTAVIKNWFLSGNRDNTSEVWRVITDALETL